LQSSIRSHNFSRNLTVVENLMIDPPGLARPKPTTQVAELVERMQLTPFATAPLENTSIMVCS